MLTDEHAISKASVSKNPPGIHRHCLLFPPESTVTASYFPPVSTLAASYSIRNPPAFPAENTQNPPGIPRESTQKPTRCPARIPAGFLSGFRGDSEGILSVFRREFFTRETRSHSHQADCAAMELTPSICYFHKISLCACKNNAMTFTSTVISTIRSF